MFMRDVRAVKAKRLQPGDTFVLYTDTLTVLSVDNTNSDTITVRCFLSSGFYDHQILHSIIIKKNTKLLLLKNVKVGWSLDD